MIVDAFAPHGDRVDELVSRAAQLIEADEPLSDYGRILCEALQAALVGDVSTVDRCLEHMRRLHP
jgi:phage tail protein X